MALAEEDGPPTEAHSARTEGHGALTALVTARLSIASSLVVPERRRLELAAEAVCRARDDDDAALAACLAALCDAVAGPDHCAERRDRATVIIDIGGRLRDPVLGLLGRRLRLVALLETGAIADWDADALATRSPPRRCAIRCTAWYVPLWRGHDEVFTAGDAYYDAPGHLPLIFAGPEIVEFSLAGPLAETMTVVGKNLQAAGPDMADTEVDDVVRALSEKMIIFLETGAAPEGLFRPDVFLDLSMPTWRIQAAGAEDLIGVRKQDYPGPGRVTRWRADPTLPGSCSSSRSGGTTKASSGTPGR